MLTGKVHSPLHGELELMAGRHSLFQNLDAFCVGKTLECTFDDAMQTLQQCLVNHLIQKFQVVRAIVECPLHTIFDEIFFQVHQIVKVDKCHFRLYHPKFSQMARRV